MGIPSEAQTSFSVFFRREAPNDMPFMRDLEGEEEDMRLFGRGTIAARQRLVPKELMRRLQALLGRGLTLVTPCPAPASESPGPAASLRSEALSGIKAARVGEFHALTSLCKPASAARAWRPGESVSVQHDMLSTSRSSTSAAALKAGGRATAVRFTALTPHVSMVA